MIKQVNTGKRKKTALLMSLFLCLTLTICLVHAGAQVETASAVVTATFDLSQGNVEINATTYSGVDSSGAVLSGAHLDSNQYVVMQSSSSVTSNKITLLGASTKPKFDVTLNGVNCAGSANQTSGGIVANALAATPMEIVLRLQGENSVGRVHYATGAANEASVSSLKITSASGDGSTEGSLTAHSRAVWSAAIGGIDDGTKEASRNITIAGGTIVASVAPHETEPSYNTSAIGGGGNGTSDVTITGGIVIATNSGTGATIGGGGGRGQQGGVGNVVITGGIVTATNNYPDGVAIGGGSSTNSIGNSSTVTISGGTVTAIGGIGGGSSVEAQGGSTTVIISGGVVNVEGNLGIHGGNSGATNGGTIDITISGGTVTAQTISGGTGTSGTATGTLEVTGGSLDVDEIPATTTAENGVNTSLVQRAITIPGITEVTLVTDVVITEADGTTPYVYGSAMYTDVTGTLYLWIPETCIVKRVVTSVNGVGTDISIETNEATFIIVIPDAVTMTGDSFEIDGSRSNFTGVQTVTVSCTGDFELDLTGASSNKLDYALYTDAQKQDAVISGGTVATFVGSGSNTTTVYYAVTGTPIYSGEYVDTLTFTVSVSDS